MSAPGSKAIRLQRAALVVTGILAALVIAEIFLRVAGYEGESERILVEFDSEFGDIPRDSWPFTQQVVRGQTFTMGDEQHPVDKPPGVRRFLFVGDSGTFGAGVGFRQAFPAVFAEIDESTRHEPIEVINAGIPGLATVGELRLLEQRLLVLEPDVVVIGFFMANDIQFNVERVSGYRIPGGGWLRGRSALAHVLYLRWMVLGRDTALSPTLAEEHGISMSEYVAAEFASYIAPPGPTFRLAYDILEETLRRLQVLARAQHFELALVILPTLATLAGRPLWNWDASNRDWPRYELAPGESIDVDLPTREVLRICDRLGLTCIDPTERLRRELGTDAILPNDDHPSAAAHERIAAELHDRFLRERARFLDASER